MANIKFDVDKINLSLEEAQEIVNRCAWCVDYVDMADELSDYGCIWDSDGADLYYKALAIVKDAE